ncbi:MAG TPA: hypothetical protein DCM14_06005 [Clostridiales bacterium UBA8153]|nr:hypothetical protein [Clostridiales bacterium UBA8153]
MRTKTEPVSATELVNQERLALTILEKLGREVVEPGDALVLLNSDSWGAPETGRWLMEAFLAILAEGGPGPGALVLVNRAVLLSEAGPAAYSLSALEMQGVEVLLCSASVREHGVVPVAGRETELPYLVQAILRKKRVITL